MTAHESETKGDRDHAREQRLDALLRSQPLTPPPGFADAILRRIAETDATLDVLVDERLASRPLRHRPELTEKFLQGVLRHARTRNILRWAVPALAASIAILFALQIPLLRDTTSDLATSASAHLVAHPAIAVTATTPTSAPPFVSSSVTGRDSAPALAASSAPSAASLPAASTGEEILALAMAADPALAAMLRTPAQDADIILAADTTTLPAIGFVLDSETVEAFSGLNDNTLAWLETLTHPDNENTSEDEPI